MTETCSVSFLYVDIVESEETCLFGVSGTHAIPRADKQHDLDDSFHAEPHDQMTQKRPNALYVSSFTAPDFLPMLSKSLTSRRSAATLISYSVAWIASGHVLFNAQYYSKRSMMLVSSKKLLN